MMQAHKEPIMRGVVGPDLSDTAHSAGQTLAGSRLPPHGTGDSRRCEVEVSTSAQSEAIAVDGPEVVEASVLKGPVDSKKSVDKLGRYRKLITNHSLPCHVMRKLPLEREEPACP